MSTRDRSPLVLRVFVSSPGDVAAERFICEKVLVHLQDFYRSACQIKPIFWEHEPLLATESPQPQLPSTADVDIVITILWSRLGTRLPPGIDGEGLTGTEFEYTQALHGWRKRGSPELLVYFKDTPFYLSVEGTDAMLAAFAQKKALDQFLQRWFFGPEGTCLKTLHKFVDGSIFEKNLDGHLRKLIEQRLERDQVSLDLLAAQSASWKAGSPFRGLDIFDFDHAKIFFGRTRAVVGIVEALKQQAASGRAFVLVVGPSGSGKSSVVRAGVLPLLSQPGVIEGVGLCRRLIFRPGRCSGDLFDGLASELLKNEALPELGFDGTTPSHLAAMLRDQPQAVPLLIKGALSQAAAALKTANDSSPQPQARLLVVVDQLEELFTDGKFSEQQQAAFTLAISALATSGQTWVLATLRSDFYAALRSLPQFVSLKEGRGQHDLQPPTYDEIGQMIRLPAEAAGLRFEEDSISRERLEEVIREAAARNPDSMPLLEFALEQLYQRRTDRGVLTFASYEALDKLEGAIATRAESVFASLPQTVQAELPNVFRQLVTVSGHSEDTATRKHALLHSLEAIPTQKEFTHAFINARLLVADMSDNDVPIVRLTHESLLTRWDRLTKWLDKDRDLLKCRARLSAAAAIWDYHHRRSDLLLQKGKQLDEAIELKRSGILQDHAATSSHRAPSDSPAGNSKGEGTEKLLREFIDASQGRARRLLRTQIGIASALIVLIMTSAAIGVTLWRSQGEVAHERTRGSIQTYANLIERARREYDNHDLHGAFQSLERTEPRHRDWEYWHLNGLVDRLVAQIDDAHRLLYMVVPTADGSTIATIYDEYHTPKEPELPGISWSEISFHSMRTGERTGSVATPEKIISAEPTPDGKSLLCGSREGTLYVFDIATAKRIQHFQAHKSYLLDLAVSHDGTFVVTCTGELSVSDHGVKLWSLPDMGFLRGYSEKSPAHLLALSSDDTLLAIAQSREIPYDSTPLGITEADTVYIYNLKTGQSVTLKKDPFTYFTSLAFSPDGTSLATSSGRTVELWDSNTGERLPHQFDGYAELVAFSPDGLMLVGGRASGIDKYGDSAGRIWDSRTGKPIAEFFGSPCTSYGTTFFADGARVVSGRVVSSAGAEASIWRSTPRKPNATLNAHTDGTTSIAISLDGRKIVSGGKDALVRVWDLASKQELHTLRGHQKPVTCVAWLPDDARCISAGQDGLIKVWDAATGKEVREIKAHQGPIQSLAVSPDGRMIVSYPHQNWPGQSAPRLEDCEIKVWDMADGRLIEAHPPRVGTKIAFDRDGNLVVPPYYGSGVDVLDLSAKQPKESNTKDRKPFMQNGTGPLCVSPNGKFAVLDTGSVTVFDLVERKGVANLFDYSRFERATCAAYSPNGKRIVGGATNHHLNLWDVDTGALLYVLHGHTAEVTDVKFSPDGMTIVSSSLDGTIKVWEAHRPEIADGYNPVAEDLEERRFEMPRWHLQCATDAEKREEWFAARFHLRALLQLDVESLGKSGGVNRKDLESRLEQAELQYKMQASP